MRYDKNIGMLSYYLNGFMAQDNVHTKKINYAFIGGGQAGGKIVAEALKLGYYGAIYNTCQEDLIDLEKNTLQSLEKADYKTFLLEGFDGAAKSRQLGLKAIKHNQDLIKKELVADEKIKEADFVWIVIGLGGGTGNGSLKIVSQIVSKFMRPNKRHPKTNRPLIGVIAAVPESFASYSVKENAAKALKRDIEPLQKEGHLGACILLDNESIQQHYIEHGSEQMSWETHGNANIIKLLSEIDALSGYPSTEQLDKSEALEIFSSPGYLIFGQHEIDHSIDDYTQFLDQSFNNQTLFVKDINLKSTQVAGMYILRQQYSKLMNDKQVLQLKRAYNKFLQSKMVKSLHLGVSDIHYFGTYKNPQPSKDRLLIYTMAVTAELPESIMLLTSEVKEFKEAYIENSEAIQSKAKKMDKLMKEIEILDVEDEAEFQIDDGQTLDDLFKAEKTKKKNKVKSTIDDMFEDEEEIELDESLLDMNFEEF